MSDVLFVQKQGPVPMCSNRDTYKPSPPEAPETGGSYRDVGQQISKLASSRRMRDPMSEKRSRAIEEGI